MVATRKADSRAVHGSHKKVTVYDAIAKDGRQFFRTYDRFDAPTFIEYLKAMQRHFGKVVAVVDRASPHRAKLVRKLLRENKNIKIIYLPKGSPYLNAVEECWHQGKRVLLVSEYYKTFTDMCSAISTYYRTARFKLGILKFANRKAALFCTNLPYVEGTKSSDGTACESASSVEPCRCAIRPKRWRARKHPNKIITPDRKDDMVYVGLDLHKKTIQIAAVDDSGTELMNKKIQNTREALAGETYKIPSNSKYVIES